MQVRRSHKVAITAFNLSAATVAGATLALSPNGLHMERRFEFSSTQCFPPALRQWWAADPLRSIF